jgi:hypothetical protein
MTSPTVHATALSPALTGAPSAYPLPSLTPAAVGQVRALQRQLRRRARRRYAFDDRGNAASEYGRLCTELLTLIPRPAPLNSLAALWPSTRYEEDWARALADVVAFAHRPDPVVADIGLRLQVTQLPRRARRFYRSRPLTALTLSYDVKPDVALAWLDAHGAPRPTPRGIPNLIITEQKVTGTAVLNWPRAERFYQALLAEDPALADQLFHAPPAAAAAGCRGRVPHPRTPGCNDVGHTQRSSHGLAQTTAVQLELYSLVELLCRKSGYPLIANSPHLRPALVFLDGRGRNTSGQVRPCTRRWRTESAIDVLVTIIDILLDLAPDAHGRARITVPPDVLEAVWLLYSRQLYF